MSRIRGKNTKIEHKMKRILLENKIQFEQHPKMFGNPDFLVDKNMVIFVMVIFGMVTDMKKRKTFKEILEE